LLRHVKSPKRSLMVCGCALAADRFL